MKKGLLYALALVGFTATAHAGDLVEDVASMKDPIPDNLTFHGVTVYGTIDVGYAYQTHGFPLSGNYIGGLSYIAPGGNKTISSVAEAGLDQSAIGVKIEENLGYGWAAIGKLEARFNPLSGELESGPGSLARNNGVPLANQTSSGDSGIAGQAFAAAAFAGVRNLTYGTITVGRQTSLQADALGNYDALDGANAFSLLGYFGSPAGAGGTDAVRWDNSVKYVYEYGPVHAGAMYTQGGHDTGLFGSSYGANIGGTYRGFSVDAVYTKEKGLTSLSSLGSCPVGFDCSNSVAATLSDTSTWSLQGKYTFDIGGGFKDGAPRGKLTFYGGYENITFTNPTADAVVGDTGIGGFTFAQVTTNNYATANVQTVAWTGAKYELPSGWSFAAGFYRKGQNSYLTGANATACVTSSKATGSSGNCAGNLDVASFLVDYQVNKHFDVYGGVAYSDMTGGFASGALSTDSIVVMTGARLKF